MSHPHCGTWRCPDCREHAAEQRHPLVKPGVHSLPTCTHGLPWSAGLHGCPDCWTNIEATNRKRRRSTPLGALAHVLKALGGSR